MNTTRRSVIKGFVASAASVPLLLAERRPASAAYPERSVKLVVPFAVGGNADIQGRIIAEFAQKVLGKPIVIENRGGAGGGIGAEYVARAEPDGYTLLVGSNGPMTVNPIIQKTSYDTFRDFTPIALTSYVPHVVVVNGKLPITSFAELVSFSKKEPVNIGMAGVGSATHMSLERMKVASGGNFSAVPYRSGGALQPDLIGGFIHGAVTEFSVAYPLHKSGLGRIIAVASDKRHPDAPQIPTLIEGGVNVTSESFTGILGPANLPATIAAALEQSVVKGMTADADAKLRFLGAIVVEPQQMSAAGLTAYLKMDYDRTLAAARAVGLAKI